MVQILEEGPSLGQRLLAGLGNVGMTASQLIPQEFQRRKQQQAVSNLYGEDASNLPPQAQLQYLKMSEKLANQQQKSQMDQSRQLQDYQIIKDQFGDKAANLWMSAPQGGKTELLKNFIDATLRGQNINELLGGTKTTQPTEEFVEDEIEIPQMTEKGDLEKDFKWPNFSKRPEGYTPKEWNDERKTWRKENNPVFTQNRELLKGIKKDIADTERLKKISPKLPEGLQRLLINPNTGELYGLAQLSGASPEVQEWSKILARFSGRAKNFFGSRVTNFDLFTFMKQFPSLLNTKEGRDRILDMMDINMKLDQLYSNALDKVYKKYKLNGISQEDADDLAQKMIKNQTEDLYNQYQNIEDKIENPIEETEIVRVIGPDGKEYEMESSFIDQLPKGYRLK